MEHLPVNGFRCDIDFSIIPRDHTMKQNGIHEYIFVGKGREGRALQRSSIKQALLAGRKRYKKHASTQRLCLGNLDAVLYFACIADIIY